MKNIHNAIHFHHKPTPNLTTIIIPAHKRTQLLQITLESATTQSIPRDQYEIIVANDGGDPQVTQTCDKHSITCIDITPHQGSYVARNTALAHARGQVIAFIDSDIIVPPDWLEKGRRNIQKNDYIGGPVMIHNNLNPPNTSFFQHLFHTYEYHTAYKASAYLSQFHFLLTGNLFLQRNVIEAIGGFDRRLQSSGDYEFGDRVWRAGYTQQYIPELEVIHPPTTYGTMLRKQQRLAKGSVTLHTIYPQRFPQLTVPLLKTTITMWLPRFDMQMFSSLPFHTKIFMYLIRYSFHITLHFWKIWYTVILYKKDSRS